MSATLKAWQGVADQGIGCLNLAGKHQGCRRVAVVRCVRVMMSQHRASEWLDLGVLRGKPALWVPGYGRSFNAAADASVGNWHNGLSPVSVSGFPRCLNMGLRSKIAVCVTAIYLCGFVAIVACRWEEFINLSLNSLGDFLAGSFGPLALAWLVFGYFQQGDELRQGTEALNLQAAELNASVQAQHQALENHERSIEPILIIDYKNSVEVEGEDFDNFSIVNMGEYCDGLVLSFTSKTGELFELDLQPLHKGADSAFSLAESFARSTLVSVKYRRASGKPGQQDFHFSTLYDGRSDFVSVRKV